MELIMLVQYIIVFCVYAQYTEDEPAESPSILQNLSGDWRRPETSAWLSCVLCCLSCYERSALCCCVSGWRLTATNLMF